MKKSLSCATLAMLLFTTACSKPDVSATLETARQKAQVGTHEAWEEAYTSLDEIHSKYGVDKEATGAANFYAFYLQSMVKTNRDEKALDYAQQLADTFPDNFMLQYMTGKIHFDDNRMVLATTYLERAIMVKENDPSAMTLLLQSAAQSENPKTDSFFEQAATLPEFSNDYCFYNEWGIYLNQKGANTPSRAQQISLHIKAIRKFTTALQRPDAVPAIYKNIAITYDKHIRNPKLAREFYKKYLFKLGSQPNSNLEARIEVQNRMRELAILMR
ncbi:MAG: hypothetical protein MK193_03870 [Lentisphaeria bacterium]|nr:hypothetical protein [Lentisphaeria bacterium]